MVATPSFHRGAAGGERSRKALHEAGHVFPHLILVMSNVYPSGGKISNTWPMQPRRQGGIASKFGCSKEENALKQRSFYTIAQDPKRESNLRK